MRTAQQDSIRSPCSKHATVIELTRHDRLLPAHALLELQQPLADAVAAFGGRHHCGLRALDLHGLPLSD